MRILVTDAHTRAALAAVRSLARLGEVHVAQARRGSIASVSRFATRHHDVSDPAAHAGAYAEAICALVSAEGIDVVMPVTDAACAALLPARERLAPAITAGPSAEAFARVSDKARVAEVAARLGIAVPPGALARDLAAARCVAQDLGFPVVVKPVASVVVEADGRMRRAGVERVQDAADLADAWERSAGGGPALVQRVVPGWGEGLFVLRRSGITFAVFAHRRLREKPPQGGVSTLCESLPVDPIELASIEALLDEAGFDGVAMAEFRTDGARRWLIEVNARLWGSLQLAIDAGVDFPRLLVETALGRRPDPVRDYRVGIRSRWLLGDVDHAILVALGRSGGREASKARAALRVLASGGGPRCRLQVLRADDPAPFIAELCEWLHALARRGFR